MYNLYKELQYKQYNRKKEGEKYMRENTIAELVTGFMVLLP